MNADRSIPACAGKPCDRTVALLIVQVDPRVRGEAEARHPLCEDGAGRSPRARGSHRRSLGGRNLHGSIPACAGKPSGKGCPIVRSRVDPRVRGEATATSGRRPAVMGRSPRARGSPCPGPNTGAPAGSIPACAGKPSKNTPNQSALQVDPRVRGEAQATDPIGLHVLGRSPRARGSPLLRISHRPWEGSIPACAGKPSDGGDKLPGLQVDPRVRGEASARLCPTRNREGRSPRARGSLLMLTY